MIATAVPGGPAARLAELAARPTLRWLGLMSGTSLDGIDVAVVEVTERGDAATPRARCVGGEVIPFAGEVTRALLADFAAGMPVERAAAWDARLGALFADAALRAISRNAGIDAIALSGHTFAHLPAHAPRATLQLGNPAIVARATGMPVVAGFRAADVANGGEGAPLVPAGDRVFFAEPGRDVVVLNLGGIANLTWLPAVGGEPRARDAGPCNLVLNEIARDGSAGALAFDAGGALAAAGRPHPDLVERWLDHPFFAGSRRSTGREEFGETWVHARRAELATLSVEDRLATAVEWSARAIALAIARTSNDRGPARVLAGGGGTHNRALVAAIARCAGVAVEPLTADAHGVSADLREAAAFAILGHEWLHGRPGSFPGTTACRRAAPIGSLWV